MYAKEQDKVVGDLVVSIRRVVEIAIDYRFRDPAPSAAQELEDGWAKVASYLAGDHIGFLGNDTIAAETKPFRGLIKYLATEGLHIEAMHRADPSRRLLNQKDPKQAPYTDYLMRILEEYSTADALIRMHYNKDPRLVKAVHALWTDIRLLPAIAEGLEDRLSKAGCSSAG